VRRTRSPCRGCWPSGALRPEGDDTVNDLDNVLYEISNESGPQSAEWQYH